MDCFELIEISATPILSHNRLHADVEKQLKEAQEYIKKEVRLPCWSTLYVSDRPS